MRHSWGLLGWTRACGGGGSRGAHLGPVPLEAGGLAAAQGTSRTGAQFGTGAVQGRQRDTIAACHGAGRAAQLWLRLLGQRLWAWLW